MNTELKIVRLKYSVIECYLSYSFNSIQFARIVNKKMKPPTLKGQTASWHQLSLTEPTGPVVK